MNADTTKDQSSGLTPHEVELAQERTPAEPEVVGVRHGMFGATPGADTTGYGGLVRPILVAGAAERPYGGYFDEIADNLERGLVGGTASYAEAVDQRRRRPRRDDDPRPPRAPARRGPRAARRRRRCASRSCTGVSGVHYPTASARSCTPSTTSCRSPTAAGGSASRSACPDDDRHIPSIVSVYPANDWHERETWDMFGIEFDGHPALTRILMPDDWPGHPQRKDYPLGGIPVEYKGATIPPPDQRRSYN